jgi:hypothetical protein
MATLLEWSTSLCVICHRLTRVGWPLRQPMGTWLRPVCDMCHERATRGEAL